MIIDDLGAHRDCISTIAQWHFDQWGPLTGADTLQDYVRRLDQSARSDSVPAVTVDHPNDGLSLALTVAG